MTVRRVGLMQRRVMVGHTQDSLAAALGVERSTVGRWERGLTGPQPQVRPALAEALRTSDALLEDLLGCVGGAPAQVPVELPVAEAGTDRDPVTLMIPVLRQLVDAYDMPDDGPVRSFEELQRCVTSLVGWRLESKYLQVAAQLPVLLPELTRSLMLSSGRQRQAVAQMLVQVYRATDAIADKFGLPGLSARIIQVMLWAADQSGDKVTTAAAAYVRAETFLADGRPDRGRRMLELTAEQVNPGLSAASAAAYGSLHMRAAVSAARAGQVALAGDHIAEARAAARSAPDGIYAGTAFGPSSVRIHWLSMALDMGDLRMAQAAAAAADWVPPPELPAERRSHFYIDVARAQVLEGRHTAAEKALFMAARIAPEHIRVHPQVRAVRAALAGTL